MTIDRRAALLALAAAGVVPMLPAQAAPGGQRFLLGADVSWLPEDEAAGAEYWYGGKRWDLLALIASVGFNEIKVRAFVDPSAPDGYSADAPKAGWTSLAHAIALGKRITRAGMGFTLSLNYAANWADPQGQPKPLAWKDLHGAALQQAVHDYARATLATVRRAGLRPTMVYVGNETTFGMLWPDGRVPLSRATGNPVTDKTHLDPGKVGGMEGFAALLKAAIAGIRAADPATKIVVHNHLGRHWLILRDWVDALRAHGVPFDAVALSCYQQAAEGDWATSFTNFCTRYPATGLMVAEYSSRKRYLNDLVHDLPNGQGWGTFIWEPVHYQEAIFDKDGRSAGEGPRPNLISQGMNSAEAPGGGAPKPVKPEPKHFGVGGRLEGNAFLDLYRRIATDYGLRTAS